VLHVVAEALRRLGDHVEVAPVHDWMGNWPRGSRSLAQGVLAHVVVGERGCDLESVAEILEPLKDKAILLKLL